MTLCDCSIYNWTSVELIVAHHLFPPNVNLPRNIYLCIERVQSEKVQNLFKKVKFQEHFPKYKI